MRLNCVLVLLGAFLALSVGERAESHDNWERIVKRTAETWRDENYEDDAAHIVNVQDYYRHVFQEGWDQPVTIQENSAREQLIDLLHMLQEADAQGKVLTDTEKALIREEAVTLASQGGSTNIGNLHKKVRGRYIVMFQESADDYVLDRTIEILQQAHQASDQRVRVTDVSPFSHIGKGFTATLNSKAVELLRLHPLLELIEQDTAVKRREPSNSRRDTVSAQLEETAYKEDVSSGHVIWNLDRLDQHHNTLDGRYIPESNGENVDVYILDTGIRYTHQEFEGRAKYAGYDAIDDQTGSNQQGADCRGHGTHCAGTVGGKTYGVAKRVNLLSARALDCTGSGAVGGIIQMMDFIIKHQKVNGNGRPAVISESIGIKSSPALNAAVRKVTEAGIVVVSAAGNQADDSCKHSPASARVGISVGATDQNDKVETFSNTGACTDIFAPGSNIKSASDHCDTCTAVKTGTSMSCPHAAGYAAILMGVQPRSSAAEIKQRMLQQSTKGVINLSNIPHNWAVKTENRLLYVPEPTADDNDLGSIHPTQEAREEVDRESKPLLNHFMSLLRLNR